MSDDRDTLDRIAVAIRDAREDGDAWCQARAALAELRNPTEHVAEMMSKHAANGMVDWRELHEALIDAVLSEADWPVGKSAKS